MASKAYDNMYPGWEADYLGYLGAKPTPGNVAFFDYWHQHEETGSPAPLNPFSEGGTGGFLGGRKDVKPWYDAFCNSSVCIAGFKQAGYGGFDTARGIQVLTPDLVKMLRGESYSRNALADEIGHWGTQTVADAIRAGTAPGLGGGGPAPVAPPPGGGAAPPANCTNDNFNVGTCNGPIPSNLPKDLTGFPCCASTPGQGADVTGACSDPNCTVCCGAGISNTGAGSGGAKSGSCQCAHIHIPLLGGFNLLPCFICDFFDAITSETFWIRAGEVIGGVILVIIGLRMFVGGSSFTQGATRLAAKTAEVG